jgi:hypothetical protein
MPDRLSKLRRWSLAHPVIAVLLVLSGVAAAAITVTYTTTSAFTTSVTPPPIQFLAGDDAGPAELTDYVSAFAISANKTYITTTVLGVPEATLTIDSYFKLENVDDAAHTVTLTTPQVSNANVAAYTLAIYDDADDSLVDTMDLRAASPDATLAMGAGDVYYAKLTLTLASGAGLNNVALSNALSLSFA